MLYQKLRLQHLFVVTLVILSFATCKNEYVQEDPVCFETEVMPIIIANCAGSGCHNAVDREEDRDYTTYEGIMRDVTPGDYRGSELYSVIARNFAGVMPPKPNNRLSDDQIRTIATWIAEGATNDSCTATVNCDTAGVVSYTAQVKPILNTWCNSCHAGAAQLGGGISLSTHAGVKVTADNGSLVGSIQHAVGFSQMPKGAGKLSNCQIATIKKWVDNGALNN
jgi:mono/diheme cytochrome c family protein